jgi:hypothetical protein
VITYIERASMWRLSGTMAVLALAALLSLATARPGFAAADAGEVLTFYGDCFRVVGDQRIPLKTGDTVRVGDVVEVPMGSKLKLRMIDGSVVSVASGARMTVEAFDVDTNGQKREAKFHLDTGLIRAVVAEVGQPSSFEVNTATGVAAARSTDWFVEAERSVTRVSVLDGSVSFARREPVGRSGTGPVLIPPRSASEIDARGLPTQPRHATQAEFDRLIDRTSIPLGWCQCIADRTIIRADCEASESVCKASCSMPWSFIPNARQSCATSNADTLVRRPTAH